MEVYSDVWHSPAAMLLGLKVGCHTESSLYRPGVPSSCGRPVVFSLFLMCLFLGCFWVFKSLCVLLFTYLAWLRSSIRSTIPAPCLFRISGSLLELFFSLSCSIFVLMELFFYAVVVDLSLRTPQISTGIRISDNLTALIYVQYNHLVSTQSSFCEMSTAVWL